MSYSWWNQLSKTGLIGKHNWQSSCRENIPFQILKVGFFDDVKYLNITETTDLKEIDDLPCIDLISPEITDDTIEGRCIGVHIKWCASCLVWNVRITETQLGEETVTCINCNITTLSSVCNTKLFGQLVTQTRHDKKILKFTCFDDAISSFLKSTDCQTSLSDISLQDLKEIVLRAGDRKILADKTTQVISQFLSLQ